MSMSIEPEAVWTASAASAALRIGHQRCSDAGLHVCKGNLPGQLPPPSGQGEDTFRSIALQDCVRMLLMSTGDAISAGRGTDWVQCKRLAKPSSHSLGNATTSC